MTDIAQNNFNLEAHYSNETKVKRPQITAAQAPGDLPTVHVFSDKDASKKMSVINNDIYEGTKKKKTKHEFNKSLYFKIFGGVTLLTAGIAGVSKIRKFFRKS